MWFGTQDGLNRYDGTELKTYYGDSLLGDAEATGVDVKALCISNSGRVYALVNRNILVRYDPEAGTFTEVISLDSTEIKYICAAEKGYVLLAGDDSLVLTNGSDLVFLDSPFDADIYHLCKTGKTTFLVTSNLGELAELQVGEDMEVLISEPRFSGIEGPLHCYAAANGNVLVTSSGDIYAEENGMLISRLPLSGEIRVSACMEGPDGLLWIGTSGDGIYRVDVKTGGYTHESTENGLHDDYILSLYTDGKDTVWAGSWSSGAAGSSLNLQCIEHVSPGDLGLSEADVMAVEETSTGDLWLSILGNGILVIKTTGELLRLGTATGLPSDYYLSLMEDSAGRIWAGTAASGVVVIDPVSLLPVFHYHTGAQQARRILSDKSHHTLELADGSVVICQRQTELHSGGISLVDPQGRVTLLAVSETVWSAVAAGERVILGTEKGLKEFVPRTAEILDIDILPSLPKEQLKIWTLWAEDQDTILAGTLEGLFRLSLTDGSMERWSTKDGLANNVIYAIAVDNRGEYWVSTNKGISRITPYEDAIFNFKPVHGLQSMEFNLHSLIRTKTGDFIFGGINGYNRFNPDTISIDQEPLHSFIGELRLFNVPIDPGKEYNERVITDATIETLQGLQLRHGENSLMFQIRAPNYLDQESTVYRYRLRGFDENLAEDSWIAAGKKHYAAYTNLPPGRYQFQFQATVQYGRWPDTYETFDLEILPSFFQTVPFKMLVILAVLVVLAGISYYFLRLSREIKERQRVELVLQKELSDKDLLIKEVHHRVKNNLSVIISLINLQEHMITSYEDGIEAFSKMKGRVYSMALVHEALYMNENVSSIDMTLYINDIAEYIVQSQINSSTFHLFKDLQSSHLDITKAIPCGLILNEVLTNAIKHAFPDADGGEIHIRFARDGGSGYELTVRDNGIGLPADFSERQYPSVGMSIIDSLVLQLEGRGGYSTSGGTVFKIFFPG